MTIRYLSVCSGIEAATQAWHGLGWQPVAFSEIEPFPCAVLAHHYPTVPNRGDMTKFEEWPDDAIDLLVGGTPCFPAGTMIATERGFIPIEDVRVGDQALTHLGRFRRIVRVGSKIAPTVTIKGQGHPGFTTTANHPFYARRRSGRDQFSAVQWVRADSLAHHHWACVSKWPVLAVPDVAAIGREKPVEISDEALFILAGAYLGDGWMKQTARRGFVYLGLNQEKLAALRPVLDCLRTYTVSPMRTSVRVQIASRTLARWLSDNFGHGAEDKRVPMWALGLSLSHREALLRGYQITDGGRAAHTGIRATTVSRQLALTMRSLAVSTGHASSVHFTARPPVAVIEGRRVSQRDTYTVSFSPSDRTSFEDGGFRWQLVRSVAPTGHEERVFDIEVAEDHSYVADGICVHNCQDFSVAGLGAGLDGERGNLMLTYGAIARRYRPRWLAWENVPGVLSNDGGRAFASLLGLLSGHRVEVPAGGWKSAGAVEGIQSAYGLAWRVVDAQFARTRRFPFAVPQRRRRVFVVGYLGDWRRAAAVLFDRDSLSGNPAPRREAGQKPAPTIAARTRGGGGLGTDFDCDGGLIAQTYGPSISPALKARDSKGPSSDGDGDGAPLLSVAHALRGEGFDASEDGTGRGTPIVPVAGTICRDSFAGGAGGRPEGAAAGHFLPVAFEGDGDASTQKTDPAALLRGLRCAVGAEAFAEWGSGILDPLQSPEVLRSWLHGERVRCALGQARSELDDGALARAEGVPAGALQRLWQAGPDGRSPQGRELAKQLAGELGKALPVLPHQEAPWAVRRLTPREAERLQGFPDDFTSIPTYDGWRRMDETEMPESCEAEGMKVKQTKTGWWVNDPDGPRYKALGNSMAVNVMEWLGERIAIVDAIERAA